MQKETIFRNKSTFAKQFEQKTASRIHTELAEHEKEAVEILVSWSQILEPFR